MFLLLLWGRAASLVNTLHQTRKTFLHRNFSIRKAPSLALRTSSQGPTNGLKVDTTQIYVPLSSHIRGRHTPPGGYANTPPSETARARERLRPVDESSLSAPSKSATQRDGAVFLSTLGTRSRRRTSARRLTVKRSCGLRQNAPWLGDPTPVTAFHSPRMSCRESPCASLGAGVRTHRTHRLAAARTSKEHSIPGSKVEGIT
mmetsp:Transcript_5180/g.16492  ORF Transcript_5180/g.16492 Transcript_5180/m.16492 type:complete len:202 (-) Transcript_5180:2868-3473(-)|eukprot:scaffold17572_cov32-Tisochrysis_lutea.AAC.4